MKQLLLALAMLALGAEASATNYGGHTRHRVVPPPAKHKKENDEVRGRCVIEADSSSPFEEACSNLVIVLANPSGDELRQSRTDAAGNFVFGVPKDESFKIQSGSDAYIVLSPQGLIRSGTYGLHLKLKRR